MTLQVALEAEISHACQVICDRLKGGTRIVMMEGSVEPFVPNTWKSALLFSFWKCLIPKCITGPLESCFICGKTGTEPKLSETSTYALFRSPSIKSALLHLCHIAKYTRNKHRECFRSFPECNDYLFSSSESPRVPFISWFGVHFNVKLSADWWRERYPGIASKSSFCSQKQQTDKPGDSSAQL